MPVETELLPLGPNALKLGRITLRQNQPEAVGGKLEVLLMILQQEECATLWRP